MKAGSAQTRRIRVLYIGSEHLLRLTKDFFVWSLLLYILDV